MATLPEDLVILAVGAKPRGGPNNGKLPWRFQYGMRGAVLVALVLDGRVGVADGQIVVRDPRPLGDANLDEALAGLAARRAAPVAEWMGGGPAGFVTAYFDRLEAAGVLRSETVWLLLIARRKGYRLVDPGHFENLRYALRNGSPAPARSSPAWRPWPAWSTPAVSLSCSIPGPGTPPCAPGWRNSRARIRP